MIAGNSTNFPLTTCCEHLRPFITLPLAFDRQIVVKAQPKVKVEKEDPEQERKCEAVKQEIASGADAVLQNLLAMSIQTLGAYPNCQASLLEFMCNHLGQMTDENRQEVKREAERVKQEHIQMETNVAASAILRPPYGLAQGSSSSASGSSPPAKAPPPTPHMKTEIVESTWKEEVDEFDEWMGYEKNHDKF